MNPNDPPPPRDRPTEAERAAARRAILAEIRRLREQLAHLARQVEEALRDDQAHGGPDGPEDGHE